MVHLSRRRWDTVRLALGVLVVGGAAVIGALAGDTERIGNYWTHAEVTARGSAQIAEVIDYDFGPRNRHGMLREIPGANPGAGFVVTSPSAPDQVEVTSRRNDVELRIGDPDQTISGRHRYNIAYPLGTLVEGDRIAWNAVGLSWSHPINNLEAHLTTNREVTDLACHRGSGGERGGCDVVVVSPRHLLVRAEGIDAGEALTIEATLVGSLVSMPPAPSAPIGLATDPGSGWQLPTAAALAAALAAGAATSRRIRHLGREQVWIGGAADAAFGGVGSEVFGHRLVDQSELATMATIEFAPPSGISAAAGGIIYAEKVTPEHQVAWLIECAIREEIVLDDSGIDMVIGRGPAAPHPAVAARLDTLFSATDRIELGTYDEHFATSWSGLTTELEAWRSNSGLWDPKGHSRRNKAIGFGLLAALVGLAATVLGAIAANRAGVIWVTACVAGALLAGAGLAAMIRSWELPVRTPEGSGRWLLIESFRRFIAGSEAQHAEAAARMGLLREYTAWAVALGELDHWQESVDAAAAVPGTAAAAATTDYRFVTLTTGLSSAATQTFTAPSSSSGGGGGGGAGGGGGGGGGGSW